MSIPAQFLSEKKIKVRRYTDRKYNLYDLLWFVLGTRHVWVVCILDVGGVARSYGAGYMLLLTKLPN